MTDALRIVVLGGGPSGLYAAYLLKTSFPNAMIRVLEQNPEHVTTGFGVVFSEKALDFLRADDPETLNALEPAMETWRNLTLDIEGTRIAIDGVGFSAISRLHLINVLTERLRSVGVEPEFGHRIERADLDQILADGETDLVIGADGVGSQLRTRLPDAFGASQSHFGNRFAWYGVERPFDSLTQSFRRGPDGPFNAHHYRYTPTMSTFIVETTDAIWRQAGLGEMDDTESKRYCERVFEDVLQGTKLISNMSIWRQFPKIWCENWYQDRLVLLGDAAHTAHFSIGSGTRLALEDAISLNTALVAHFNAADGQKRPAEVISDALSRFLTARQPIVRKLVTAANESAEWYESFDSQMDLAPWDFAISYMRRGGRLTDEKLQQIAPAFMAGYKAQRRTN